MSNKIPYLRATKLLLMCSEHKACGLVNHFGLLVLSSPASVSVCLCINHLLVSPITHRPFKLGSPNLSQRWKSPWLGSLLLCGSIDCDFDRHTWLKSLNLHHFELLHTIPHHLLKLQSNHQIYKWCKTPWLRSLLLFGLIDVDVHVSSFQIICAGNILNRSYLLTKRLFCRKSSMDISIANRYWNRFIHLRRSIFTSLIGNEIDIIDTLHFNNHVDFLYRWTRVLEMPLNHKYLSKCTW